MRRLDKDGRDITDLPGLWDESDLIEFPIKLPGFVFEQLKAEVAFRGIELGHLASLWLGEAIQNKATRPEDELLDADLFGPIVNKTPRSAYEEGY